MNSGAEALGLHLLADYYDASALYDPKPVCAVLERAARAAGANVLEIRTHDFGNRAGFTGVALLAESHISLHTWPEHGYVAIDIFMCGAADPKSSLSVLEAYFDPKRTEVQMISRGLFQPVMQV